MFLDIDIAAIQNININKDTQIIFLINYESPLQKIFDLLSIHYIVKNLITEQIESILKDILKVNSSIISINKIIGIRENRIFLIDWGKIIYIYADKKDVNIFTDNNLIYKSRHTLKFFEGNLPTNIFFRCHRSFLVNIEKVNEISPYFNNTFSLKFDNHKEMIPVGRNYIKNFKTLIGL